MRRLPRRLAALALATTLRLRTDGIFGGDSDLPLWRVRRWRGGGETIEIEGSYLFDTGSGDVRARRFRARRTMVDTGSGGIHIARSGVVLERRDEDGAVLRMRDGRGRIRIDTGSGRVTIR